MDIISQKNSFRNLQALFKILQLYINKNIKYLIVIIISTSFTLVSIYFLICAIVISQNSLGDISKIKKTYTFELNENINLGLLSDVFTYFQVYPSSTDNLFAYRNVSNGRIEKIKFIFSKELEIFNDADFSYQLYSGRFFTDEEIEDGEKNIVLDYIEYKSNYSEYEVGDTLSYGGSPFTLIGINKAVNDSGTILIYSTFYKDSALLKSMDIQIHNIEISFSEKLSNHLLIAIKNEIEERTGQTILIKSLYTQVVSGIIPYFVVYILFIGLILLLFIICIKQLFIIVDTVNEYKYSVLHGLGMHEWSWKICKIISIKSCIFVSYINSIICFYCLTPIVSRIGFNATLPIRDTLIIYILLQVILVPSIQYYKRSIM